MYLRGTTSGDSAGYLFLGAEYRHSHCDGSSGSSVLCSNVSRLSSTIDPLFRERGAIDMRNMIFVMSLSVSACCSGPIVLLSPQGGERFCPGDTIRVRWTNVNPDSEPVILTTLITSDMTSAPWSPLAATFIRLLGPSQYEIGTIVYAENSSPRNKDTITTIAESWGWDWIPTDSLCGLLNSLSAHWFLKISGFFNSNDSASTPNTIAISQRCTISVLRLSRTIGSSPLAAFSCTLPSAYDICGRRVMQQSFYGSKHNGSYSAVVFSTGDGQARKASTVCIK